MLKKLEKFAGNIKKKKTSLLCDLIIFSYLQ